MAGVCRVDLKKAVSMYGSVSSCPKRDVINHMYHTWKYLQRTKHYKLQFRKQMPGSQDVLECWVDASFADNEKARSATGYLIFLNGAPISSGSVIQGITADSTGEAEIIAAATATKEVIPMRNLLEEMKISQPLTKMHEDNSTTVSWVTDYKRTKNNKHIHKKYWLARQAQEGSPGMEKQISMVWCETHNMWADMLTKNTTFEIHDHLVRHVMDVGAKACSSQCKPTKDRMSLCCGNRYACSCAPTAVT
jgi:hypothetical protein